MPMEIDFTVVAGVSICLSLSERNVIWLWGGRGGVFQKGVREELRAKRIKLLGRLYKLNGEGHELSPYPELPLFLLPEPLVFSTSLACCLKLKLPRIIEGSNLHSYLRNTVMPLRVTWGLVLMKSHESRRRHG